VITAADLDTKRRHLDGRSSVDYGLGAHAVEARLDELSVVWAAGAAFIKGVVQTLLRGHVVAADGVLVGERRGRFVHGRRLEG